MLVAGADCETAIRASKTRVFDACILTSRDKVEEAGYDPTISASETDVFPIILFLILGGSL